MHLRIGIPLGFVFLLFVSPAFGQPAQAPKELKITRITPAGEDVPAGRQIVIQFNRSVVPVGRMERKSSELPIEITPPLNCQWRWLNTNALACQLTDKDALKKAHRCKLLIRPGIKAEDGATIKEDYKHEFITQRPKVRYVSMYNWKGPGQPVFRLAFNQPVTIDSVAKHLSIEYTPKDAGEKDSRKRVALIVEPDPNMRVKPREDGVDARDIWLVAPKKEMPLDVSGSLILAPGLISALGPEASIEKNDKLKLFHTFPEFRFLGLECTSNENKKLLIKPSDPREKQERCNPLRSFRLQFTSPVTAAHIKQQIRLKPNPFKKEKEEEVAKYERTVRSSHRKDKSYDATISYQLKAFQEYQLASRKVSRSWLEFFTSFFTHSPETNIKDAFGRPLFDPIALRFATNHRLPDFELDHNTAVLEKNVETHVPLYVTNLDQIDLRYKKLRPDDELEQQTLIQVPKAEDIAFAIPLKIRNLIPEKSGALYGTIQSTPFVKKHSSDIHLFAQVTPYHVHVKIGHYNTLLWITDLTTGRPVSGVKAQVKRGFIKSLKLSPESLADGTSNDDGIIQLPGTEILDPKLKWIDRWSADKKEKMFLLLEKGEDIALLPLDGRFSISTYTVSDSVYSYQKERYGHIRAWGTTAQGIYRAGDTIQYKIYVRNEANKTLVAAPSKTYELTISDPTGKEVHKVKDISLSEFGAYHGEVRIPKKGAVGWYEFRLKSDFYEQVWWPLRVLVTDFTPAPFKVETSLNGDLFQTNDKVEVTSLAKLHSGGPYTQAQARVTAVLREKDFHPTNPVARNFDFDTYLDKPQVTVFQTEKALDDEGRIKNSFKIPKQEIIYGELLVETSVQDDRGKSVANRATASFVGVDRLVGLRATQWIYPAQKPARFETLVVDPSGKPIAGTSITATLERRVMKAARIKGAGNAYLKGYTETWEPVGKCQLKSQTEPVPCDITPKQAGTHRLTAEIHDTQKRVHRTQLRTWIVGSQYVLWDEGNDFSLKIVPEKEAYHVGETARYLIKNPFPGAKALISIERYGVIKHWTQTLENSTSVLEFPIEPDFLPGFYLSVLVTSPRVDKPLGEGNVDLGKPTFRLGYVKVPVRDPYKEMTVDIKTNAKIYKPRERVHVSLQAQARHPQNEEPVELAVAVLDEAVFDLIHKGKSHFDPYEGFYRLGDLDLTNFNLLTRLIGIQKFEKKGANPGGGGGGDVAMRSVFKFVSYWNPTLETDESGQASFDFELPDNLTGWRILALAVTPTDRMGLGQGQFKVNRPTQIQAALPNQISLGDRFDAGFSIMNRTDKSRTLDVTIEATGPIDTTATPATYKTTVTLKPYKRTQVWMPIKAKAPETGQVTEALHFKVVAGDALDRDGLELDLPVLRLASFDTAAEYGTTIESQVETSIQFPDQIRTDVGDLSVLLTPTVIGNVAGAFRYMADYPYTCWEQRLSKGIMASHYQQLKKYLPAGSKWEESAKVTKQTLEEAADFQTPSGAFAYYKPEDPYASPYLSAYTALAFNWLRRAGHEIPSSVEEKLLKYLDGLLKQNVVPNYYSAGMTSTVRAVALAALAAHGKIHRSDLERYRTHVGGMSLFGKAHYLQAALQVPDAQDIVREVTEKILAHSQQSAGKFLFNEELDDSYTRILATSLRTQCAILTSLVTAEEKPGIIEDIGDIPFKMVRALTQARGKRSHWENTQENVFCLNALIDYSRLYESVTPDMQVTVRLDQEDLGETQFTSLSDKPVTLKRALSFKDPGRKATLVLDRQGTGRLYYASHLRYALLKPSSERVNAGIEIRREYSVRRKDKWVLLKPGELKRGDVVRVDIFLSLPTARYFVVVDDPVPGGLEPINRDLATASLLDAEAGEFKAAGGSWWFKFSDWTHFGVSRWSFYHKELRHNAARFYSEYLSPGNYHLSYTAQAIATGEFHLFPIHAEEMYDPDVYGKGLQGQLQIDNK